MKNHPKVVLGFSSQHGAELISADDKNIPTFLKRKYFLLRRFIVRITAELHELSKAYINQVMAPLASLNCLVYLFSFVIPNKTRADVLRLIYQRIWRRKELLSISLRANR